MVNEDIEKLPVVYFTSITQLLNTSTLLSNYIVEIQ